MLPPLSNIPVTPGLALIGNRASRARDPNAPGV